jgi:hypothetical protein
MKTLHITPGDSAGGSLIRAVRDAGRDDEVLRFRDDLSCGPIDSDDPSARASWWSQFYDEPELLVDSLRSFWGRATGFEGRLILWFGRHSARELAFSLAWADRIGDRPYNIIDVTGLRLPIRHRDGGPILGRPAQAVSIVPPIGLRSLLGTERLITLQEKEESRRRWRRLRAENAPFRIVAEKGLVSASIDTFDPLLLAQATTEWRKVAQVIGNAIAHSPEPYLQVGDMMLLTRVVALVEARKLVANGDPWQMSCRIRLPG